MTSGKMSSEPGYDINHLQDPHDVDPSWRDGDIDVPCPSHSNLTFHQNDVFHLLSIVGTGVTAKNFLAKKPHSFKLYAIKRMQCSTLSSKDRPHNAVPEKLVLQTITSFNAPFLPRLYSSFIDPKYLYLIMDFCARGDFLTHLLADGVLDPDTSRFYSSELVVGISSLHDAGIVHRNLKPENVLIGITGHIIITGFGCAKPLLPQDTTSGMMHSSSFCGTKEYQFPEMILEWAYDFAVDIWGFGILLYLLNFGQYPFMRDGGCEDPVTMHQQTLLGPVVPSTGKYSPPLVDLIRKCLEKNTVLRPKMEDIKGHHYFSSTNWNLVTSKQMPVPPSRILDSSNIYIPLNLTDDGVCLSRDTVRTIADYDRSEHPSERFSFEWDDVSEEDEGLTGEIDSSRVSHSAVIGKLDLSLEHVATLLNAIEEVSEGEERSTIAITDSAPADAFPDTQGDFPTVVEGTPQLNIFRRLFHNYAEIRNRCKKIYSIVGRGNDPSQSQRTLSSCLSAAAHLSVPQTRNKLHKIRPSVTIMLSGNPTSSLSFRPCRSRVSVLSVTATTHPLCHSDGMFSRKKSAGKDPLIFQALVLLLILSVP